MQELGVSNDGTPRSLFSALSSTGIEESRRKQKGRPGGARSPSEAPLGTNSVWPSSALLWSGDMLCTQLLPLHCGLCAVGRIPQNENCDGGGSPVS